MSQCDRGARANENVEEADAVVGPFAEDGVYTLRVPILVHDNFLDYLGMFIFVITPKVFQEFSYLVKV